MIEKLDMQQLGESWIDAWNRHDIDAIMEHYADDVEFWSPLIAERLGIASGKLVGKDNVRAYFTKGLAAFPNLHFTLVHVLKGMDSMTIYYRKETGAYVAEVTVLDAAGKAVSVRVHYTAGS